MAAVVSAADMRVRDPVRLPLVAAPVRALSLFEIWEGAVVRVGELPGGGRQNASQNGHQCLGA